MWWWWWWVVVDQAITNPISGPSLSFVFCLLALSLTISFCFFFVLIQLKKELTIWKEMKLEVKEILR